MARWNFSLVCSPQPIARFLRLFPKLALLFLIVHVGLMIYALLNTKAPVKKSLQKAQADIETVNGERFLSKGLNDSFNNNNNNNHSIDKIAHNNTFVKGKLSHKLFNRGGHHDVR